MSNIFLSALRKIAYHINRVIQAFPDHTTEVDLELEYEKRGRIPWSLGYRQARDRFIRQTLGDQALMDLFRENRELPQGFGVGFDERCIEYPWLLSKLRPTREQSRSSLARPEYQPSAHASGRTRGARQVDRRMARETD